MDANAVVQASERIMWAEDALVALRRADDFPSAEKAWSSFLLATSTFFSKLQQGSKTNGKSKTWFGRQLYVRKNSPVLRYIHFARNADEHGIIRVTVRRGDNWWQGRQLGFGERISAPVQRVDQVTLDPIGEPIKAWALGPYVQLVRAYDTRYNDYCDPPELKDKIGTNPIDVAEEALPLPRRILAEAAELILKPVRR